VLTANVPATVRSRIMADIEIHTVNGWVPLKDVIQGRENCDKCGKEEGAEGAGYQQCDPPELIIYFCRECR
jgi:hypothetical protein